MTLILPIIVILSYLFFRQVWYHNRKIKHLATIEKIKLSIIKPNLILPEVEVFFKYQYGGGLYIGRGFVKMLDFNIPNDCSLVYNQENTPVLTHNDKIYANEEHIEAFLLNLSDKVNIHIDPVEPYRFEIINLSHESQNPQNKI
jgi:hypothetical protein